MTDGQRHGAHLAVAYVVALILALGVQEVVDPPSAPTKVHPESLFGIEWLVADAGADLHIVHLGVLLVMLGALVWVQDRSPQSFLRAWIFAWLALVAIYSINVVESFAPMWSTDPDSFSLFGNQAFEALATVAISLAGSIFVLRTGLRLRFDGESSERVSEWPFAAMVILIGVVYFFATAEGSLDMRLLARSVAVAGAPLTVVATGHAGLQIQRRMASQVWHSRGYEILGIFTAYAALQFAGPWLARVSWNDALFAASLLAKTGCSLAIIAVVLVQAEERQRAIAKRRNLLGALERQRASAFAVFREFVTNSQPYGSAAAGLLTSLLKFLSLQNGLFLVRQRDFDSVSGRLLGVAAARGSVFESTRASVSVRNSEVQRLDEWLAAGTPPAEAHEAWEPVISRILDGTPVSPTAVYAIRSTESASAEVSGDPMGYVVVLDDRPAGHPAPDPDVLSTLLSGMADALKIISDRELYEITEVTAEQLDGSANLQEDLRILALAAAIATHADHAIAISQSPESSVTVTRRAGGEYGATLGCDPRFVQLLAGGDGHSRARYFEDEWAIGDFSFGPDEAVIFATAESAVEPSTPLGHIACVNTGTAPGSDRARPFMPFDLKRIDAVASQLRRSVEKARARQVFLTRNIHELRDPIANTRNIRAYLQRKMSALEDLVDETMTPTALQIASMDIAECQEFLETIESEMVLLRSVVDEADEYRGTRVDVPRLLDVFNDIVMPEKTQLKFRWRELGLQQRAVRLIPINKKRSPQVLMRPSQAHQVASNVIGNALKYRDVDSDSLEVKVAFDEDGAHYLVRFQSYGIGVPEGWEDRIFEEGVRAPNAVQRDVEGSGVGLYLSRRIARELGGDLTLIRSHRPTIFLWSIDKSLGTGES
ncbi:MAG: hypothetical protein DHS20C21_05260 [Gemmatimonadota bacterium]|nr:MAG: hypothetical protein DHS20C21_05260 [Gemmatimonadota bacterium]